MRIISLFVAFFFSVNVMASTGTVQQLERYIDDYQFALSVEWDQKDQAFYEAQTAEFFGNLEKLIKEEGLTQKQIMTLVETKVGNKKIVDALKLKLSLLAGKSSPAELAKIIQESSREFYSQGASWNGEVIITVTATLLVAAVVAYVIWWDVNHECVEYKEAIICQYICNDPGSYYGGMTYHYPTGCFAPVQFCGPTRVCSEYAKK